MYVMMPGELIDWVDLVWMQCQVVHVSDYLHLFIYCIIITSALLLVG